MNIVAASKLLTASWLGYGLRQTSHLDAILSSIRDAGYFIDPERLNMDSIARLNEVVAQAYSSHPSLVAAESAGTDRRIYGVDLLVRDSIFRELTDRFLRTARSFYNSTDLSFFWLAGDIHFHRVGLGSGSGWHRDSPFRHQFKVIIYLTDVSIESGPFEYIPESHKAKMLQKASLALSRPLDADRFEDAQVQHLLDAGVLNKPASVTGLSGTVMYADTRGLHRGRPLAAGQRRAVTFYCYHRSLPRPLAALVDRIHRG
jgi:hypothetical protein